MSSPNRRDSLAQAADHSLTNPHKRRRGNPRYHKKQPPNTSRPLSQRLHAMRTTHWRIGSSYQLNPKAPAFHSTAYIMTTSNGSNSNANGATLTTIPSYNPEFTFKASPPMNPNNPQRSLTLRGGQEAGSYEDKDLFHGRKLVDYSDLGRLTPSHMTPAKLPPAHPSLPARPPSPERKTPCKIDLPSTDSMSPMHPSRKRKAVEIEYESGSEEATPWVAPPTDWAIVDKKLVRKKSIDDTTLLMKEDESATQYLERAKKVHSAAPQGEKYAVRKGTLMGIHPYIRRMRVHTSLAESSHMIAPGWLSETTTWSDIVAAVHAVLRQETIEALRAKIGVLRRNDNESIKHFFEYVKMHEEEVVQCDDEQLYDLLVRRTLDGLDDMEVQLRAQIWLRIDGLLDGGGELVRNVKVDDIRDAVFASSKLIGAPNEFVLLEEYKSKEVRRETKAMVRGEERRVPSGDSGVELDY